jgi:hypothetical protein
VNLSTVFLVPSRLSKELFKDSVWLPPENYDAWEQACSALGTLRCLQTLTIDMTFWNYHEWQTTNTIGAQDYNPVLSPLRRIKARKVELEINVEIEGPTRAMLESLNFSILYFNRPYNSVVFRQG